MGLLDLHLGALEAEVLDVADDADRQDHLLDLDGLGLAADLDGGLGALPGLLQTGDLDAGLDRSEEHTSELQSLMRISYAVFCLKKKKTHQSTTSTPRHQLLHLIIH